jgi:hypothetical protein
MFSTNFLGSMKNCSDVKITQRNYSIFRVSVLSVVFCFFAYVFYWLAKSLVWAARITLEPAAYSPPTGFRIIDSCSVFTAFTMEYTGFLGLLVRFAGASYALYATYLLLRKDQAQTKAAEKASDALVLEGLYFLSFIPAVVFLLRFSALPQTSNLCLSGAFIAQMTLNSPALIWLALQLRKHSRETMGLIKAASLAAMNYTIALWVTYILKWTEMTALEGFNWLFSFPRSLGFLNTASILSLSALSAVAGAHSLRRPVIGNAVRWFGLSATLTGVHTAIYTIYCAIFNVVQFIQFGELWTLPLIALGLYLLLKNPKTKLA